MAPAGQSRSGFGLALAKFYLRANRPARPANALLQSNPSHPRKKRNCQHQVTIFHTGFTLVELLVAVAVIAVGMVFVLGAFSQCISALTTAERTVTANYLMNQKIWEISLTHLENNGSEEGEWSGDFQEPYQGFGWTQSVGPVSADFGDETSFIQESFLEELVRISWTQGRATKDISVVRYVPKKQEI